MASHQYSLKVEWTGNTGAGTSSYRAYERAHAITAPGKPVIPASSDPAFRGDSTRYNPEELLVASLSSCHMLWFLHLATEAGLVVVAYEDTPLGAMHESADGSGAFTDVLLRPRVTIRAGAGERVGDDSIANAVHERAHAMCFIASSVNFPVRCEATLVVA